LENLLSISSFAIGALFGSFFSLVQDRATRGEEFIRTPSHCVGCNTKIPFYYNIPILSFLFLRGRCHNCREKIPKIFFIKELLSGMYFILAIEISNFNIPVLLCLVFFYFAIMTVLSIWKSI